MSISSRVKRTDVSRRLQSCHRVHQLHVGHHLQALDSRQPSLVLKMIGDRTLPMCRGKKAEIKHLCLVRVPDSAAFMHGGMANAPIHTGESISIQGNQCLSC